MNDQIKARLKRTIILSAIALAIGAGVGIFQVNSRPAQNGEVQAMAGVKIGGPFTLTDMNGGVVTEKSYGGQYKLIYFGFTMCPVICPTGLQKIAKALDKAGPAAERVQPVFITIDPERDTPDTLKQYVKQFHPRLVGLTGTKTDIERVEKSYHVYASKAQDESATDYLIDHSTFTYFIDPDGNLLSLYKDDDTADFMADDIRKKIQ